MFYFNDSWVSFYVGDIKISISAWFVMAILVIICLIWQDRVLDVSKATLGRISPSPRVVNFIMISACLTLSYWLSVNIVEYILKTI